MTITIKNKQKKIRLNSPQISQIAKKILHHEGIERSDLTFVFVTHQKIRAMNKQFLNRNYATDVLAFDINDNAINSKKRRFLAGDIIISTDAARKNSKLFSTDTKKEITLYVIHGILHLCGFDDHRPKDRKKMRKKEQEILERLKKDIKAITK